MKRESYIASHIMVFALSGIDCVTGFQGNATSRGSHSPHLGNAGELPASQTDTTRNCLEGAGLCLAHSVRGVNELAPLLCAFGEADHHDGQSIWWTKVAGFLSARKEEKWEEVGKKTEKGLGNVAH